MSMKDLRGKVLVMFEGDVSGVDYGRVADYVVHQHNHKLYPLRRVLPMA